MKQTKFNLIALDIIEGLDDSFYVVDINGYIGLQPIIQNQYEFNTKLHHIFNNFDIFFDCPPKIENSDRVQIGNGDKNSPIIISNKFYELENKTLWRKYDIKSPQINENINPHNLPNYPKYLIKPKNAYRSILISLWNQINPPIIKDEYWCLPESDYFLEEFIPSKLIDNKCYSIRVICIANKEVTYPILYLNRLCKNPIIENLKLGELSDEDNWSYISNSTDENRVFFKNENPKLKDFMKTFQIPF